MARKGDKRYLIPIEWKYTETYQWKDYTNSKLISRYEDLIKRSVQLKMPEKGVPHSVYCFEPCYELMRQTLLMEQMIRKGVADDFIHINVVPDGNLEYRDMIRFNYLPMLKNPDKFIMLSPTRLLEPMRDEKKYERLLTYLTGRY